MKRNLLLTPGPTQVPPRLCEILGRPIMHHRTPQFQEILKATMAGLKAVLKTQHEVCLLAGSGTAAMEACVSSLFSSGETVLTVEGGKFGERWTEIARAYGLDCDVISVEWGQAVAPQAIAERLKANPQIRGVFVTLCETSTGVTSDIEAIGRVVRETSALLVVDAVSGLGVTPFFMDDWGVDAAASASHKGLMLPPGAAFVGLSPKACQRMETKQSPAYYFDLRKYVKSAAKNDTPFTPAIGIVAALAESLKIIEEAGLDNLWAHYARLAEGVRAAVKALGLELFADECCISNVLTPVRVPAGIDGGALVKTIRDTHGISMAGGQGPVKGKIFRIAHMGCLDEYDMLTGIACLEKVLKAMGMELTLGSGLAAAQSVFSGSVAAGRGAGV